MNERIRELAVQAEKLADEATNAYNDDTGNWRKVWNEVYDEKFAELIVKECLRVSYKSADMLKSTNPAYSDGIMSNNLAIREHFGVK